MSYRDKNPRQIVDQFLGEMGRPVSEEQSDRAVSSVLERLQTESAPVLDFAVTAAKSPSARSGMWRAVAAAAVVMLAGALLPILLQRSVNAEIVARPVGGEIHAVGKSAAFLKYSRIEAGRVVKAGEEGGAVTLVDGSQIEMSPEAVLSVVRETDGLRVRLSSGIVLVSAARQRNGNFFVET